KLALLRIRAQPRVITVRLKHQHACQPPHPVNVGKSFHSHLSHAATRPRRTRRFYFIPLYSYTFFFNFSACLPRANSVFSPCSASGPRSSSSSQLSRSSPHLPTPMVAHSQPQSSLSRFFSQACSSSPHAICPNAFPLSPDPEPAGSSPSSSSLFSWFTSSAPARHHSAELP